MLSVVVTLLYDRSRHTDLVGQLHRHSVKRWRGHRITLQWASVMSNDRKHVSCNVFVCLLWWSC